MKIRMFCRKSSFLLIAAAIQERYGDIDVEVEEQSSLSYHLVFTNDKLPEYTSFQRWIRNKANDRSIMCYPA